MEQITSHTKYFLTVHNTAWIYPIADIQYVLARTTTQHTFDGHILIVNSLDDLITLYGAIYDRTSVTQPVGNVGYTLGVGTQLEDIGKDIFWQIKGKGNVIHWRLMKQLTPQLPQTIIPTPGNSPPATIGYGTIWVSYKNYPSLDEPLFVRTG